MATLKEQSLRHFMQRLWLAHGAQWPFSFFTGSPRIFKDIQSFTVFYGIPPNGISANVGNGGSGCGSFHDDFLGLYFRPVFWSVNALQRKAIGPFESCTFLP